MNNLENIVILGGGTAGWMVAAALSKVIKLDGCKITLVESEAIGTVGVGEATIPQISTFNSLLGIDENDFLAKTQGTFKLGIEFVNWGAVGESYMHPFGAYGMDFDNLAFYHYWQKAHQANSAIELQHFSLNTQAAYLNKFMRSAAIENSPLSNIVYAYHFDASQYAHFLRNYAEQRGVLRIEGVVDHVQLDVVNGDISALCMKDGGKIEGDFFIDCSGFRGLLIEKTLKSGYDDWSQYLLCDRAWAVPSAPLNPLPSYTRATAKDAGWQWRIPLQHRTGNGYVYSSAFLSDEAAELSLLADLESAAMADPRNIQFKAGKRREIWKKNCVAIGLASGFLEPLESTSIHLVQSAISKLLALFPRKENNHIEAKKFNAQIDEEYIGIRDFIIAHYKYTQREDSEFWRYCKNMPIPDSLQEKVALYKSSARLYREKNELFGEQSWLAVLHGQGVKASSYNPLVDGTNDQALAQKLDHIRKVIAHCVDIMPLHSDFIAKNVSA